MPHDMLVAAFDRSTSDACEGFMATFNDNKLEYSILDYRQLDILESIIDNVTEGVAFGNTKGELVMFNSKARQIMGRNATDAPHEHEWAEHFGLFYEDTVTRLKHEEIPMVRACLGETIVNLTLFVRNAGQPEGVFIVLNARPIFDKIGAVIGGVVIFRDITAEKKHQEALEASRRYAQEAKDLAEYASRCKTEFLANISHEIRTPLTAILGFSELLRNCQGLGAEERTWIDAMTRNSSHLLDLVDQVLDLSKIEAGQLEHDRETFSLQELVVETVRSLQPLIATKPISINFDFKSPHHDRIESYKVSLKQILINIIGNAIKFTDQGQINIVVSATLDGVVFIDVKDSGMGIPLHLQSRLFQPFTQADTSISRKYGGTGLGLVLSKRLAGFLDGDLTLVESQVDKGAWFRLAFKPTKFHIALPVSSTVNKEQSQVVDESKILTNMQVLVVEDCTDNQTLLRVFLERAGAKVEIASDGNKGFELATKQYFDVVLMDMQMPYLDGYSAARMLRQSNYLKPIIALTAHVLDDERERCISAGCDDYLSKPIDPSKLVHTIKKFGSNKGAVWATLN